MKRAHSNRQPKRKLRDIKADLTKDQLAAIGAISFAYNYAELAINRMLPLAIGLGPGIYRDVITRINGIDGKIAIVKKAAEIMGMPPDMRTFLGESLGEGAFAKLKKFRDAVIHSRIYDLDLGLGELLESKGRLTEVLLTQEALDRLYDHLNELSHELGCFIDIFMTARKIIAPGRADQEKAQLLEQLRVYFARSQQHRTHRLSLPPLPEFPEEPKLTRGPTGIRLPTSGEVP